MFTKPLLAFALLLGHAIPAHAGTPEPAKPADPPAEAAEPPADDPEPPATDKAPGGGKIGRRLQAWCDVKHLSKADCRKVRDKLREKRQAKAGKAQPKP
jgi:hypothetical protein